MRCCPRRGCWSPYSLTFRFVAADRLEHLRAIEATDDVDLSLLSSFVEARLTREE
jgi:hypothetical protein